MSWSMTLPMLPMSLNKRERAHYWQRKKELAEVTEQLGWLAKEACVTPATGRRAVRITIHKSLRSRVTDDPANRDVRSKAVLDALVNLGFLLGDSDRELDWHGVHEGDRRKVECTVIDLWEVES